MVLRIKVFKWGIWGGDFFITAEDAREVSAGLVFRQEDGGQALQKERRASFGLGK
jgi:hypothetical protein